MNFISALIGNYFNQTTFQSVALLAFRLSVGLALMFHGMGKIQNPFGWLGDGTPGFLQALAAVSEFGGGIAIALGFLTPLASLGVLATMAGALQMVHLKYGHPYVSADGGPSNELATVYLVSALLLLAVGPGKLALDYPFLKNLAAKLKS